MNLEKMLELTIAGREDIKKSLELEKLIKKYIQKKQQKKGGKEKNRFKAEKYLKEKLKEYRQTICIDRGLQMETICQIHIQESNQQEIVF